MRLKGKVALVTGASRGIGSGIAKEFAEEGATVILNFRSSKKEAEKVHKKIKELSRDSIRIMADVSKKDEVTRMFNEVRERFGRLDILVNNAGHASSAVWNAELREITPEMFVDVFNVDLIGTFLCSQAAAGIMKQGSIINVTSTSAIAGDKEGLVYATVKGSVISLTKMLARYLAPSIRVNCIAFGSFRTRWLEWLTEERRKSYLETIPLGRFGEPEDAGRLAVFLASDDSSFLTGQTIILDGGEVMC